MIVKLMKVSNTGYRHMQGIDMYKYRRRQKRPPLIYAHIHTHIGVQESVYGTRTSQRQKNPTHQRKRLHAQDTGTNTGSRRRLTH